MAFVGMKVQESATPKRVITVTINRGRIGVVFRKGVIAPGTLIDVLVGTEEDFGKLLVKRGVGRSVKKFGNSDNVVSWGGCRKITEIYPPLKRAEAIILSDDGTDMLLQIVVPGEPAIELAGADVAAEPAIELADVADGTELAAEPVIAVEETTTFELGLDPEEAPVAEKPAKSKKAK